MTSPVRGISKRCRGFTLVELLVVIAIIAILISVLLPTFIGARRAANAIKCAANLHAIGQGLGIYLNDSHGWLPGSPFTTGAPLFVDGNPTKIDNKHWQASGPVLNPSLNTAQPTGVPTAAVIPNIMGFYDWMSPIAAAMGLNFDRGPTELDVFTRFQTINNFGSFVCPANTVAYVTYSAATWQPNANTAPKPFIGGLMPSYVSAMAFVSGNWHYGTYISATDAILPETYAPNMSRIGNSSRKIFIADGARWSAGNTPPDVNLDPGNGELSNTFSDGGPWDGYTRAWWRGNVPVKGNQPYNGAPTAIPNYEGPWDPRIWACPHGVQVMYQPADRYRMNALFFDGHVETLGDLEAANPTFWLPRGSVIPSGSTVWTDVLRKYGNAKLPIGINE
jgi:prepilin-type N-terminal cleavage/methylation domain-containing protein/prepilin-type processing-associated H-X9-DG protein